MQTITINSLKGVAAATLLGLSMLGGGAAAPAFAIDPDIDVICFEFKNASGEWETECETVDNLRAECALADPENTNEMCQDVNSNRGAIGGLVAERPVPQSLTGGNADDRDGNSDPATQRR